MPVPRKAIHTALLLALAAVLSASPADAASRLCRKLEAALSQTGSQRGGGGMAGAYERAIAAQAGAIAETRARLGAARCGSSFFGSTSCGRLQASLRVMQRNLQTLRRTRAGMTNRSAPAERKRLLASLEANGCRGEPKARPASAAVQDVETPGERPAVQRRAVGGQPFCVRTCDGYFFPMTRTTAPVEDQAVCEAACPGTPMEVFYRRSKEGAGAMVSGSSRLPYAALATANLFRDAGKARPPGCSCNAGSAAAMSKPVDAGARRASGGSFDRRLFGAEEKAHPRRPDFSSSAAMRPSIPDTPPGTPEPPSDRKVRVVGPEFLPARGAEAVPPVPAPTPAR